MSHPLGSTFGRLALAALAAGWGWGLVAAPRPAAAQVGGARGAPPPPPASQPGPARPVEEIDADVLRAGQEIATALPVMDVLFDPARRDAVAPKALPPMRKMAGLLDEMAVAEPRGRLVLMRSKLELTALMAMLGDITALNALKKQTFSTSREESVGAKAWVAMVDWARTIADPVAQRKLIDDFTKLARQNSENEMVAQVASLMIDHAATPVLREQAEGVVLNVLTSPMARQLGTVIENRRKLRALEGKPLTVEGTTVDGRPFSTAAWKGKVVLVDFWATWCPPCMAELPKVKKLYADHHARGLEIVGVSSDGDAANFKAFLADNNDMPWPQLFGTDAPGADVHPLVKQYGIQRIPAMFLIDKKGVCRSVKAEGDYEEQVKKLLAE